MPSASKAACWEHLYPCRSKYHPATAMSLALPYTNNCNTEQTSGPGGKKISKADLRQCQSGEYKLFSSTLWSPDFCSTKTLQVRKEVMEQKGWGSCGPAGMDPQGCVGSQVPRLSSPKALWAKACLQQRQILTHPNWKIQPALKIFCILGFSCLQFHQQKQFHKMLSLHGFL